MPYDSENDVYLDHHWAVVWPDGAIHQTGRTQSECVTFAVEFWTNNDDLSRASFWRKLKREHGFRIVRVVTQSLSREAEAHRLLVRSLGILRDMIDAGNWHDTDGDMEALEERIERFLGR